MENQQLKIWINTTLGADEKSRLNREIDSIGASLSSKPEDLESAEIAFGQPDVETVMRSPKLRWVQLDSAGYEKYDRDDLRLILSERGPTITNSSQVYAQPCAEHLLAMIFAMARRFPGAMIAQSSDHSWPMATLRAESRLLMGQRAILLGYGTIARTVTELLAPLQMEICGYRRRPDGREGITMVGEDGLAGELARADHVINILPASPSTRGFCNEQFFAQLKPGAIFYNIGRGVTVDQKALRRSLETGHLAGAALDVTDPEPLPADDPLWTAPNCLITPHTAGGHGREKGVLLDHFLGNLRRYLKGDPLVDQILT